MAKKKPKPGTVTWVDLTVKDAKKVRDFYAAVAGWKATGISMGQYEDYAMSARGVKGATAGVCHRLGANNIAPGGWMVYINVADIDKAVRAVVKNGGKLIGRVRGEKGKGRMVFFRDPSGAAAGLYEV